MQPELMGLGQVLVQGSVYQTGQKITDCRWLGQLSCVLRLCLLQVRQWGQKRTVCGLQERQGATVEALSQMWTCQA